MEIAIFAIFALLALGSSLVVVMHRNPVYSTMSLVVTLFSVAVLFVILGSPFIGALQVLIYTGAILVLFLFVIMLLNVTKEENTASTQKGQLGVAVLGAVIFGGLVLALFWSSHVPLDQMAPLSEELVSMKGLARVLFTEYLLPFEIVGLLLLVAVIGATVAARRPVLPDATSGLMPSDLVRTSPEEEPLP